MRFNILCAICALFPFVCQAEIDEKELKDFCEYQIMKYDMLLIESFNIEIEYYSALYPYNQGYITGKIEVYKEILNKITK